MPMPANKAGLRTKDLDLEFREIELAHLVAFDLISLAISFKRGLPPSSFPHREKREFFRIPITLHERFQIPTIPGLDLLIQHDPNLLFRRASPGSTLALCKRDGRSDKNQRRHDDGRLQDLRCRSEEHTSELQSRFDLVCR